MTIESMFHDLYHQYGEKLSWRMLSPTDKYFVEELKRELGPEHPIFSKGVHAVAKCDSNDDVLYFFGDDRHEAIYRIYHLTYSSHHTDGYPRYKEFADIQAVKAYIEQRLIGDDH